MPPISRAGVVKMMIQSERHTNSSSGTFGVKVQNGCPGYGIPNRLSV
jgi:hypothetical protein